MEKNPTFNPLFATSSKKHVLKQRPCGREAGGTGLQGDITKVSEQVNDLKEGSAGLSLPFERNSSSLHQFIHYKSPFITQFPFSLKLFSPAKQM